MTVKRETPIKFTETDNTNPTQVPLQVQIVQVKETCKKLKQKYSSSRNQLIESIKKELEEQVFVFLKY